MVIVGLFAYNIFNYNNGFLNSFLVSLGFEKHDFYFDQGIWKFIIVFFIIWSGTGYGMIIYLATIGLFLELAYWNEWYNGMLYMQTATKFPLQYFLQRIVSQANIQLLIQKGVTVNARELPSESIKMATAVVAIGLIILAYPFAQKYFISGLTLSAVKG